MLTNNLAWLIGLIVAISVHEFAHALTADRLGDPTPRLQGRLTLNPLAHLDPLGTLMLFLVHFGWGKPVQFDPFNLKNPLRDAALISLAGPGSNLILATSLAILLRFVLITNYSLLITQLLIPVITLNVALAIFNLLPIHPLDGFKIVAGFLPKKQADEWLSLQSYGIIFLFVFIFLPFGTKTLLEIIMLPLLNFILNLLLSGIYV